MIGRTKFPTIGIIRTFRMRREKKVKSKSAFCIAIVSIKDMKQFLLIHHGEQETGPESPDHRNCHDFDTEKKKERFSSQD